MKLKLDAMNGPLELVFGDSPGHETRWVAPGVFLRYAEDGRLLGIELVPDPPCALAGGSLVTADEAAGFFADQTVDQPASRQGIGPVTDRSALYGMGSEADWEGFDQALRQWRNDDGAALRGHPGP